LREGDYRARGRAREPSWPTTAVLPSLEGDDLLGGVLRHVRDVNLVAEPREIASGDVSAERARSEAATVTIGERVAVVESERDAVAVAVADADDPLGAGDRRDTGLFALGAAPACRIVEPLRQGEGRGRVAETHAVATPIMAPHMAKTARPATAHQRASRVMSGPHTR
jgi:hypothetical protein